MKNVITPKGVPYERWNANASLEVMPDLVQLHHRKSLKMDGKVTTYIVTATSHRGTAMCTYTPCKHEVIVADMAAQCTEEKLSVKVYAYIDNTPQLTHRIFLMNIFFSSLKCMHTYYA